jgi:hypothetical protein
MASGGEQYCPLCGSAGAKTFGETIRCERCGRFQASFRFLAALKTLKEEPQFQKLSPFLSAHLRQSSDSGQIVELQIDNWESLAQGHSRTPVVRKLDRLLRLFAARSETIGADAKIGADDFVLVDAANTTELDYLVVALEEQQLLRKKNGNTAVVTPRGWERLNPLDPGGVPGTCFVAMAFDPSLNNVFETGISPAITATGLEVIRVDKLEHNGVVTDLIQAEIRRAQIVVADVTLQRQGVYFEAGFAIALGRVVIWSCREDEIAKVHFDTRQYSHVVWADARDLRAKLEARIRGTVSIPLKQ